MAASSSSPCSTFVPEITRRSANYHPSIWGDQFLAYNSSNLATAGAETKEHFQQLKEEVKKMLVEAAANQQLNLIDDIQRLGVAYHFEAEIDAALQRLDVIFQGNDDDDLHTVSLRFRLLRQHGYNVSSDVFLKFKDSNGKFKECLISDPRGMLSLYEATHFRVHEEDILEDALEFTTSHLERQLKSHLKNPLAAQVVHALKYPIHKSLNRLEARHYISIYQEIDDSHNKVLLNFAKLDFNLLQKVHQGELGHISRWWKELNFAEKLPFARDRLVECYFWILGVYFEPQYLTARRILTKIISLTSIVDDIYDVYGTHEELLLFTDAIERWDISTLDQLPEFMRVCYEALFDVYNEEEEEMTKTGRSYRLPYAKDSYKELVRAYLAEAKWLHDHYVPKIEEYMPVAMLSSAYKMLATNSFVGMGNLVTKEAFDWVSSDPLIVKAASVICRLSDDMVGHEFEQKREHVASAIECYIKQYGVTKKEVYAKFQKQITNAWKDMNQECIRPTAVEMPLLERVFNLARIINLLYDDEDGYTKSSTKTKDLITSVLIDPVPL